jgi:hypothetical protein
MTEPRDWQFEYDGAAPPLPREIVRTAGKDTRSGKDWAAKLQELLQEGAYFLRFEPRLAEDDTVELPNELVGIIRVHHRLRRRRLYSSGSGDLYRCRREEAKAAAAKWAKSDEPDDLRKLQFPSDHYRYYLRLETLWITREDELILGFDTYRYHPRQRWDRRQAITLRLERPPEGQTRRELTGQVLNEAGTEIGTCRLVKVASMLRHAEIRLYAIGGVKAPDNRTRWIKSLNEAGWSVELIGPSAIDSDQEGWTEAELRRHFLDHIEKDVKPGVTPEQAWQPWIYHLMLVGRIRSGGRQGGPLGLMFDLGTDPADPPRQVAALAAKEPVDASGEELHDSEEFYYWVALHEMGHMQGLYHNPTDRGVMQPRHYRDGEFDPDRDLLHAAIDTHRLRHLPDLWVRPGGVPFGHRYRPIAIDLQDMLPGDEQPIAAKVDDVFATTGEPKPFWITLENVSSNNLVCPYEDEAQLGRGFLGASLATPSDEWLDLSPEFLPRLLAESKQTHLEPGGRYRFAVRWPEGGDRLHQAGMYGLNVHLTWLLPRKNRRKGQALVHLRARAALHVAPVAPAAADGEQRPQDLAATSP